MSSTTRNQSLESVKVGKVVLSKDGRVDVLTRGLAQLTERVHLLEEDVKALKNARFCKGSCD